MPYRSFLVWLFCWGICALGGHCQQPHPALRHYSTDQGLPSPEVYDVLQDRNGYLWFSTDNGVSRFNGYTFENFGPEQGLLNNVVFYLQEDTEGRIWMPTLSGNVYYFEKDTIKSYPYNSILQQYRNEYLQIADFYVDSTGNFLQPFCSLALLKFIQMVVIKS